MNLQEILEIAAANETASEFKITEVKKESYELFFVHDKVETVRKADSVERMLTVYVNHDGAKGMNSFSVYPNTERDELERKIDDATRKAALIFDEPYVLPNDETCNVLLDSQLAHTDPKDAAALIADTVFAANTHENCDINALEIFVVKTVFRVINSRGVDKTQTKFTVHVEAIPTANGEGESVELFESYDLADLDLDWLKSELANRLDDVKARLEAKKPATSLNCPIVLNAYELSKLFEEIAADMDYARAYMHVNLHSVGDALQSDPQGDKICLTMRGSMKGSAKSNTFDADGTNLVDREIIHDGMYVAGFGTSRFAGYLGKTPTGALGCIEVRTGTTPTEQLLAEKHLELVYLSGLQVEPLTDYIGGEIRLAYYFDGEKRTPVTGIAFSGKLSEALNTATLSAERTVLGGYAGPAKVKLSGLNIF